jgi:Ca2+-binding RTX toxin-like protein
MILRSTLSSPTYLTAGLVTKPALPPGPNQINGTSGADDLPGTSMDDAIYGFAGNDYLYGLAGNDTLDGGTGIDVMAGGIGDDVYIVDNVNDLVWEWGGEGTDTVRATLAKDSHYYLPSAVENLFLEGSSDCVADGNDSDNYMVGNDGKNRIYGNAGNDTLNGGGGDDTVHGGLGDDVIDGGTGADMMIGSLGNDVYYVDNWFDEVWEVFPDGGLDTVRASTSFRLTAGSQVEILELTEAAGNANGYGNEFNNILRGNSAQNLLIGGVGADTIYGGGGADTFMYLSLADALPLGSGFTDYIPDFNEAEGDRIDLSAIDANLFAAGDQAFTPIGVNVAFNGVAGELRFNGGFLEGDVNGDRVADFQIDLDVAVLQASSLIL